jgi:hypothetical protein
MWVKCDFSDKSLLFYQPERVAPAGAYLLGTLLDDGGSATVACNSENKGGP